MPRSKVQHASNPQCSTNGLGIRGPRADQVGGQGSTHPVYPPGTHHPVRTLPTNGVAKGPLHLEPGTRATPAQRRHMLFPQKNPGVHAEISAFCTNSARYSLIYPKDCPRCRMPRNPRKPDSGRGVVGDSLHRCRTPLHPGVGARGRGSRERGR